MGVILGKAVAVAAVGLAAPLAAQGAEPSLAERYPPPWIEDTHIGIARALVANKIGGCGEYKYRASARDRNEYAVYCTRDGKKWVAYIDPLTSRFCGSFSQPAFAHPS
jgi:hypothetical protein